MPCRRLFEEGLNTAKELVRTFLPEVTALLEEDELNFCCRQRIPGCLSHLQAPSKREKNNGYYGTECKEL